MGQVKYLKFVRPDGQAVWLRADEPPLRITVPVDSNGNAELTFVDGTMQRVTANPEEVMKAYAEAAS